MLAFAKGCFVKQNDKKVSFSLPLKFHKKGLCNHDLLKLIKDQQILLEQQINMLTIKASANIAVTTDTDQEKPPLLLEKIKVLSVKLSLNTAEQRALSGQEVESILQPIISKLIEKKHSQLTSNGWKKKSSISETWLWKINKDRYAKIAD